MKKGLEFLKKFFKDKKGASAVEYGIMVALIAAVIVTTVSGIGNSLLQAFTKVANALTAA
jgi:pilus assembly protein Flp/PilA